MTFGELRFSLRKLLPTVDPDALDAVINNRLDSISRHQDWKLAGGVPIQRYAADDSGVDIPSWVSIPCVMAGVRGELTGDQAQLALFSAELANMRIEDARLRGATPLRMATAYTEHRIRRVIR